MKRILLAVGVGAAALLSAAAAAAAVGHRQWSRGTEAEFDRLAAASSCGEAATYDPAEVGDLPAPVRRYFEHTLRPGQPLIRRVEVEHAGDFRPAPEAGWAPFRSRQHFTVGTPGFVWDARIRLGPGLATHVRDSYVAGVGSMLARVGGLVTVVEQGGTPAMAAGALHRYLAEAVWFPTGLLPSAGVRWEAVDDSTARAILSDHGHAVDVLFRFAPDGALRGMEAVRLRDVAGEGVPTPWVARFGGELEVDGMRVPQTGEVEWRLPQGPYAYWRGRITRIRYGYGY